jgi:hypothetical protein
MLDDAGRQVCVHRRHGSGTVSRLVGTGRHVFVDAPIAALVPTGAPSDIDADGGILGVIDHGSGRSHLSLFTLDRFGELAIKGAAFDLGAAIVAPRSKDDRGRGHSLVTFSRIKAKAARPS